MEMNPDIIKAAAVLQKDVKEILRLVDDLAKWDKLMQDCKKEIEIIKGNFQKAGEALLKDRKNKQVEIWGSSNAKVVITESESLKIGFRSVLKNVLGEALTEFEKEKVDYEYSAPFKQTLINIFQGSYIEQSFGSVLNQMPSDEKTRNVLAKKLKGKWDKDIETLMAVAGMTKEDAEFYAYQVKEAKNYERISNLMKAAGYQPGSQEYQEALENIKSAVIVEDGIKVGIESDS